MRKTNHIHVENMKSLLIRQSITTDKYTQIKIYEIISQPIQVLEDRRDNPDTFQN